MRTRWLAALALAMAATPGVGAAGDVVQELAFGDGDARGKAIGALVASGDAAALPLLQALIDGDVQTVGDRTAC